MFKVGEHWKSRSGELVYIFQIRDETDTHPIVGIDNKKRIQRYTPKGSYISDIKPHRNDLVERV